MRTTESQDEIDRLQAKCDRLQLTPKELEAIRWAEHEAHAFWEMGGGEFASELNATLHALLERLK